MTTRHPEPTGAAMIAAKAVMDSLLERGCDVASLAVLSRYSALPCRPMSRDIFARDSWRMCRPLLTSPMGGCRRRSPSDGTSASSDRWYWISIEA